MIHSAPFKTMDDELIMDIFNIMLDKTFWKIDIWSF